MRQYRELVARVLNEGEWRDNRTAQKARAVFYHSMSFDLREGFPLLTDKFTPFKSVVAELVGFVHGVTTASAFRELGTKIWDANANDPGTASSPNRWLTNPNREGEDDLGRIYGAQWRGWLGASGVEVDQLQQLIQGLINDPFGRRHIVSAWNPGELHLMALPPCHVLFQCYVSGDGYLDMSMYQRSADIFLGVPFNIASYAALLMVIAKITGYEPRRLHMTLGDAHIYEPAEVKCFEMLQRTSMPLPTLKIEDIEDIDHLCLDHFTLLDYKYHPAMPVPMAV